MGQLKDAGNTTTLAHYLKLLEGAGMVKGLEKFSPSKIRQRSSSPKFQVLNTALMSTISLNPRDEIIKHPDIYGRWVESDVGAHLLNRSYTSQIDLYYWCEGNDEVEFVLQQGAKTIGIEVKSGRNKSSAGITAFSKKFNPDKLLLVGRDGMILEEFLTIHAEDLFNY